jgi:hypothetical protein
MRPLFRPARPYTLHQILDHVEHHFCTENNPRCVVGNNGSQCSYQSTGCAVGCLVTQEDAQIWDRCGGFEDVDDLSEFPDIERYFAIGNLRVISILFLLQRTHDSSTDPLTFKANMQSTINFLRGLLV